MRAARTRASGAESLPGFLADDGRVFVLLGGRPFPVKDQIAGLAGEKVTLTGTPVERGGVRALQLKTVERRPVAD